MIAALEIEVANTTLWDDAAWTRAINKTVNLMSRMIPKRQVVEGIITREITDEAITVASSTATLAYKPIKKNTVTITGEIEGTDFTVNYHTGVITEIGALLADGAYTVSYELESQMYDLSEVSLTDYISIESIEYPVGETPRVSPTFDVVDGFVILRGSTVFAEDDHIRITYKSKWTPPVSYSAWAADTVIQLAEFRSPTAGNVTGFIYECTARAGDFKTAAVTEPAWIIVPGSTIVDDQVTWTCREIPTDYPSHLDDIIIIGAVGQALLQKAHKGMGHQSF